MFISKVSLVNYRNFANASFKFNKGINTIIGENGSGKTNLFRAIRLLLEDASVQYAYKLEHSDFNRKIKDWRGHWIIISIEFDDISADEAIQSLFVHGAGSMAANDKVTKATYNLFFRPKPEIRMALSALKEGDTRGLAGILDTITINNFGEKYEAFFTGKSSADFNDPAVYKELVGDFDKVKFTFPLDTSKFGVKIPHQLSITKEISFTFIKALRDVVSDFHNNRTNPLLTLLKNQSIRINPTEFAPIAKLVADLNTGIETLKDVQKIRTDIKETIKDAVGETYSPSSLSIKSSLSDEADKLLQSLKLFIGEPDESYEGGIHELSLGGANLIFLTLKLLEYKYSKSGSFANFLIVEEPEAHIHTHIQKTLFDKLDYGDTQIIYSTHSTHISEVSNLENINILAKKLNYAEVYRPSNGLKGPQLKRLQRYLDAVRTNLLFAKGVILIEGDAEEILIPLMVKKVLGVSLDELGISLINIRSTGFENVAQIFHETRIKRKCAIVTDLDQAICDTTINATDSKTINDYKTKVRNSADAGLARQNSLTKFIAGNPWVQAFYADHTFEVDFLSVGNEWEAIQTLKSIYKDAATLAIAEKELKSNDVSVYGKRILTIANNEGKGWFAILLGSFISHKTVIPSYIEKAIIFARGNFGATIISGIVKFRIGKNLSDDPALNLDVLKATVGDFDMSKINLSQLIKQFELFLPDDEALDFLKLL